MDSFDLELISLNVRGLGDYRKRRTVFNWLKKHTHRNAVILLQETHSIEGDERIWKAQWRGEVRYAQGTHNSKGVLIAFKDGTNLDIQTEIVDSDGRFIIIKTIINESNVVIVNYYAPNDEPSQVETLTKIDRHIRSLKLEDNTTFLFGGDFNMYFDTKLDTDGGTPKLKVNSLTQLEIILEENGLCDIFRVQNPYVRRFSWRQRTPFKQRRLDYIFVSNSLQESVTQIEIIPSVLSDHSAVILKLRPLVGDKRGPGYWKFNNSLINDKQFVSQMNSKIEEYFHEIMEISNPVIRWDFLKFKIRQFCTSYSKQKSRERKQKRISLESKLESLENNITVTSTDLELKEYNSVKQELEQIYNYITEGIILRTRTVWYEEGEKSTKYFLNLEKRSKSKMHIRKLIDSSGAEVTEPKFVLEYIKGFYSDLYKRRAFKTEEECFKYLESINMPQLNEFDRNRCEGIITKRECWDALSSMNNNKSPGNDGLSKEFYICFFEKLADLLIQALNQSFVDGEMSNSQRQAVITLIKKKGKDKRYIQNWRPISLINVDAKVASKCLALRLKKVIHTLVDSHQTAYVPGRNIGESVRLVENLLEYAEKEDLTGIMFSSDFEKAFDSIDHCFIFACLKRFGFGTQFIQWVKTLFENAQSCVMNNGSPLVILH